MLIPSIHLAFLPHHVSQQLEEEVLQNIPTGDGDDDGDPGLDDGDEGKEE